MTDTGQADELLSRFTARAVEAFSLWADASQRILRELVDLSASTAKEGVRVYAEIQSSAVEAVKDGQAYLLRGPDALEAAESARNTLKRLEDTTAMTRSAQRLQATAGWTGREIQATFAQLADRVQSLYVPLG